MSAHLTVWLLESKSDPCYRQALGKQILTMTITDTIILGVSIREPLNDQTRKILGKEATAFRALLYHSFNAGRQKLLQRRDIRQELDNGVLPDLLLDTKHIRFMERCPARARMGVRGPFSYLKAKMNIRSPNSSCTRPTTEVSFQNPHRRVQRHGTTPNIHAFPAPGYAPIEVGCHLHRP